MIHLSEIKVIKVKVLSNQTVDLNTNDKNINEAYNIEEFIDFFNFDTSYNLFSEEIILELNSLIKKKNNASLNNLKELKDINKKEWDLILSSLPTKIENENSKHLSFYNGSTAIYILKNTN